MEESLSSQGGLCLAPELADFVCPFIQGVQAKPVLQGPGGRARYQCAVTHFGQLVLFVFVPPQSLPGLTTACKAAVTEEKFGTTFNDTQRTEPGREPCYPALQPPSASPARVLVRYLLVNCLPEECQLIS